MCGLLFSSLQDISLEDVESALGHMRHRGPDASGFSTHANNVFLGHRRLSILDLDARSNQPFRSACGRYLMVYNGEIYNFAELARRFNLELRTSSDTEVLLELYVRYGEDILCDLNGMFAFVIYDEVTGDVFAARDRLGIKPLYIWESKGQVALASELRPLLDLGATTELDEIGVRQFLKLRTFFRGHTLYRAIRMFPAGHFYLNGKTKAYWELPMHSATSEWRDDDIRDLLESAVRYRCIADVPIGSYLSGGLDSSIIAGLAGKPDTWTIGFEDSNEFQWARIAATKFASRHHEILLEKEEFFELANELIDCRKEPLSVPNEVMLYKMTRAVKERNTVILSGEGADELFFGYDRIFRWAASQQWSLREFDKRYSYGSHSDDEILEYILEPYESCQDSLTKVAFFFQISHLHGLLRRLDNSTMMCSVEARVPFVDHRLVEYMAHAPMTYRMQEGIVKAPLKRIFRDILPEEIIAREKIGFPAPLERLFHSDGKKSMDAWLDFNMDTLLGAEWRSLREDLVAKLCLNNTG